MQHARFEIGRSFSEAGEPLFVVDGKLLGTVDEVVALIERYRASTATIAGLPVWDGREVMLSLIRANNQAQQSLRQNGAR